MRLAVFCCVLAVAFPALAQLPADEMRAHFIDVGQGDATLLEFSCGAVLIDTGGEKNDFFDSNEALAAYLDDFFKRRADLKNRLAGLVLSHPHLDHTRGVDLVIKKYAPANIVTNGQITGSGRYGQIAAQTYATASEDNADPADDVGLAAPQTSKITKTGLTSAVIDPLSCSGTDPVFMVLWGRVSTNPGWSVGEFKNGNNHSVVTRLDFGKVSFLFTGDLETDGIEALIKKYTGTKLLDADVYKVGHHGAANATTNPLLGAISPKLAVLMNGPQDREAAMTAWAHGHPRKVAIDLLLAKVTGTRKAPAKVSVATGQETFTPITMAKAIYSTGWDGTVVLKAKADGTLEVLPPDGQENLLDINTATAEDFVKLPGLGKKRADAIVKYRSTNGKFSSVDELTKVTGIGPATLAALEPLVEVRPP